MPKIPTLQQSTRLQVSSPVPIGSSQSARIEGEAIQDLGQGLARAGQMLGEFTKAARASSERSQLDGATQDLEAISQKAQFDAGQKAKADGSDLISIYEKDFDEATKPILESITDPELKMQVLNEAKARKNARSDNLYAEAAARKTKHIDVVKQATLSKAVANVNSDPSIVESTIGEFNQSLDQETALYSPLVREKKRVEGVQSIALGAVEGLASKNKYDAAKELLSTKLSGYFDEKTLQAKLIDLDDRQVKYMNRNLIESERAERNQKEANEEASVELTTKYFFAMAKAKDPEERAAIASEFAELGRQKKISVAQYNMIESQGLQLTRADQFNPLGMTEFIHGITKGSNPVDTAKNIQASMADGTMDQVTGAKLLTMNSQRLANRKKDPGYPTKYNISDTYIEAKFNSVMKQIPFQQGREGARVDVLIKADEYINSGMSPTLAAKKALKFVTPNPESLPMITGVGANQSTVKDLEKIELKLSDQAKLVPKMSYEQKIEYLKNQKAFAARKAAAQIYEEEIQ